MPDNQSPIVERTMLVLTTIAEQDGAATLGSIVDRLQVPRSSAYRILNSLLAHRFVVKEGGSRYRLGPRVAELARRMNAGPDWNWLVRLGAPLVQRVSAELGEACKLSVADGTEVTTIHAVPSPAEYGLSVRVGHRAPLYAGGSSKAILAFMPSAEIQRIAEGPFTAFTPFTITDADTLREVLETVRLQGYAEDNGEMTVAVRSFAAPIFDGSGTVVASVSVPFIGERPPERARAIRQTVLEAAVAIGDAIKRETRL